MACVCAGMCAVELVVVRTLGQALKIANTRTRTCVCVCVLYKCAQVIGYMQSVCSVHWKPECIKHGGRTAATHRIASQCQGPKCGSSAFCLGRSVGPADQTVPRDSPGVPRALIPPPPSHHRRSVLTSAARPLGLPLPRHARTHARARPSITPERPGGGWVGTESALVWIS